MKLSSIVKSMACLALVLLLTPVAVFAAPDRTGKVDAGLNVSGAIPDDSDLDGTVYAGGTVAYGVNNWLAVGAEFGWAEFDEEVPGFEFEDTAIPVLADIILRVPMADSPVQPYGIIGLGVIFWDVDHNIPNVEVDIDDAFAAKFGAGVDWFVNDNWILNFEASYVMSDTEATARSTVTGATVSGDAETDYWMIGGGVKYLFN